MKTKKTKAGRSFAVVTGASSGIGYELARQFAQNGFDLMVVADSEAIHDAARKLEGLGAKVVPVQANLTKFEDVEKVYNELKSRAQVVNALALNAGVGSGGEFAETDFSEDENLIQLNIVSPLHLTQLIVKDMIKRGEGRILFTSSVASTAPAPYLATYGASKAFLQSFAEALRNELKGTGVTVTSLMPGPTETNFFQRAHMQSTKVAGQKKDKPSDVARMGFEALMAGKDQVVAASLSNKLMVAAARFMPDRLKAQMHRRLTEPGSNLKIKKSKSAAATKARKAA